MEELKLYRKRIKGIYQIKRIKEIIDEEPIYYIGKSNDIFGRFNEHCFGNTQTIDIAIQRHGISSFEFKVLEIVRNDKSRDEKEQEYISIYIEKYGESSLYNDESGGTTGKTKINIKRNEIKRSVDEEIKEVLKKQIGISIYLVAEHFKVNFKNVINIRKPLLKELGLKYDLKSKFIVNIESGEPVNEWYGKIYTENQIKLYLKNMDKDDDELIDILNSSKADLSAFKNEYSSEYKSAEIVSPLLIK